MSNEPSISKINFDKKENKTEFKLLENLADDYFVTNDFNGKDNVFQVKFSGDTIWREKAKLKYGEVKSRVFILEELNLNNCNLKYSTI